MKKTIIKISASLVILFALSVPLSLLLPKVVGAQEMQFTPQVEIPGQIERTIPVDNNLLARYIEGIYNYSFAIVGILAAVVLMGGGVLWLTSGGSQSQITRAKTVIFSSLIGLFILFSTYLVLNTINPRLVSLSGIGGIGDIKENLGCSGDDGYIYNAGCLPDDTVFKNKCMGRYQTCMDTIPPSIEVDPSVCVEKFGVTDWCLDPTPVKRCCAISDTITAQMNSQCQDKPNSPPTYCKVTPTDTTTSGRCVDEECVGEKVCCQCGQVCNLGVCLYVRCRNDLTPKQCADWCKNNFAGYSAAFFPGGSREYTCKEGAMSYCREK